MNVVQVGLGNFGLRHLEAWHRLGFGDRLWIVEPDEAKWEAVNRFAMPRSHLIPSMAACLDRVDQVQVVDIVTPTTTHAELGRLALEAGKDVFIEKPMTMTSAEARRLTELAQQTRRMIQVGFYYRFHPLAQRLSAELAAGRFGPLRYLSGTFAGFKRARMDVGVTHTDGIHWLDLFNWLLGESPVEVSAVCRDHFGRGLEDFSIVLMTYPSGVVAKVESGYIQPGRWKDKVVAGAMTTKEITLVGAAGAAEADFEAETLTLHAARHELRQGVWAAVIGETIRPPIEPCDPVQLVCRELAAFVQAVEGRQPASPGPIESGVQLAMLMEAIYASAARGTPVRVESSTEAVRAHAEHR